MNKIIRFTKVSILLAILLLSSIVIFTETNENVSAQTKLNDTKLWAYYSFNDYDWSDASGNDIRDDSGNNNHAKRIQISTWKAKFTPLSLYGRALDIGDVAHAETSEVNFNSWDSLTIESWVLLYSMGQNQIHPIVWHENDFLLWVENGYLKFHMECLTQFNNPVTSSVQIKTFEWTQVSITWTSGIIKMYIDGYLVGSKTVDTGSGLYNSAKKLCIGYEDYNYADNHLNGIIDEMKIYNAIRVNNDGLGRCIGLYNFERHGYLTIEDFGPVVDRSGMNNHGSANECMFVSGGKHYSRAAYFDGINDYITIPDQINEFKLDSFTVSAWIRPETVDNHENVISQMYSSVSPYYYAWGIKLMSSTYGRYKVETVISVGSPTNGGVAAKTTNDWALNQWNHVAISVHDNTLYTIVNGKIEAQKSFSGSLLTSSNDVKIGRWAGNSLCNYHGLIDDVRIVNYCEPYNQDTRWMVDFKNTDGDYSYWNNDPYYGGQANRQNNGKFDYGLNLDGNGDYIRISDSSEYRLQAFTLEAWIKPDTVDIHDNVISKAYSTSQSPYYSWGIKLFPGSPGSVNKFRVEGVAGINGADRATGKSKDYSLDNWHHVALTWDGGGVKGRLRLYVDGILSEISSEYTGNINYNTNSIYVGKYGGNSLCDFKGIIDNVVISNYPKTFNEDTDGDSMSDSYEIIRSLNSDQYNSIEYNGRYAMLATGGVDKSQNSDTFWNNLCQTYDLLKAHGYCDEDIYAMYADGDPPNADNCDDYETCVDHWNFIDDDCEQADIKDAFSTIDPWMTSRDTLIIVLRSHGSRIGFPLYQEMFNPWGSTLTNGERIVEAEYDDSDLFGLVDDDYRRIIHYLAFCYSGGFMNNIPRSDQVFMCSSLPHETSTQGFITYQFGCYKSHAYSMPSSGLISVFDAYDYMDDNYNTPRIDDDADGSHEYDDAITLAKQTYF